MTGYEVPFSTSGGGSGVSSVNALTGALTIADATGGAIVVTSSGTTIKLNAVVDAASITITTGKITLNVANSNTWTGAQTFASSALKILNPASTFAYTIIGGAITAARTMTLPLLAANDTFAVLGLSQTFTGSQIFGATTGTPLIVNYPVSQVGLALQFVTGILKADGSTNFTISAQTGNVIGSYFSINTLTASIASVIPLSATLYIHGAPIASTNVTITATYALYVASGSSYFGGGIINMGAYHEEITPTSGTSNAYTVAATDTVLALTSGSGTALTVNLPAATGSGRKLLLIKVDAGTAAVTVTPNGADTIEGAATKSIASQYGKCGLMDTTSGVWSDLGSGGV